MTRFEETWLIFTREFHELLKERKTIFLAVVLPIVIYPFILGGVSKLVSSQFKKLKNKKIIVSFSKDAIWLKPLLNDEQNRLIFMNAPSSVTESLRNGKIHLWFDSISFAPNEPKLVIIQYFATNEIARHGLHYIRDVLKEARYKYIEQKLKKSGFSLAIRNVINTKFVDVSSDRQKSGYLAGKIVPILMILMILSGASFAAVDLIAGEKERGSLETLLLAPVDRQSIVRGKFLVVFIIACTSAVLNLSGIYITLSFFDLNIPMLKGVTFSLGITDLLLIILFSIPLSILFSAFLMIIASYADTFKEGQYYVLPFVLVSILPAIPAVMPNIELNSIICILPITPLTIAIKDVLSGIYHWIFLAIALVLNLFYALLALRFATRIFDHERILPGTKIKETTFYLEQGRVKQGLALFGTAMLLMYFVGSIVQKNDVIFGLWFSEVFLIALPAIVFLYLLHLPLREHLGLKFFTGYQFLGAIFLEIGSTLGVFLFTGLQNYFLPFPKSLQDYFSSAFTDTGYPLWVNLITFGLSAGLCEEILFRGALTGIFSRQISRWKVILLVGGLFGLMHFSIYRILPTALIGIAYTFIRLALDSIFPTMILHSLHNITLLYLLNEHSDILSIAQKQLFTFHGIILFISMTSLGIIFIKKSKKIQT